jgi:hypothetical protein
VPIGEPAAVGRNARSTNAKREPSGQPSSAWSRAAQVSTRSIPSDEAAANEMPVNELRRLFDVASALVADDREREKSDWILVSWVAERVEQRGLTAVAELLDYDVANLAKVLAGKRALPARLRKRVNELMAEGNEVAIRVPPDH